MFPTRGDIAGHPSIPMISHDIDILRVESHSPFKSNMQDVRASGIGQSLKKNITHLPLLSKNSDSILSSFSRVPAYISYI